MPQVNDDAIRQEAAHQIHARVQVSMRNGRDSEPDNAVAGRRAIPSASIAWKPTITRRAPNTHGCSDRQRTAPHHRGWQ